MGVIRLAQVCPNMSQTVWGNPKLYCGVSGIEVSVELIYSLFTPN